jgi:LmbE family N-acetylglucosaminyl deacetylase
MLPLSLPRLERPLRLLCVGAHSDDIEIGCGGFILWLQASGRPVDVTWVVFSGSSERHAEARRGAALFLSSVRRKRIVLHRFRDGFFPYDPAVKTAFEKLKKVSPDIVLTHCRADRHQDHRVLSDLAWNTFRDHVILEYEIPKFDGDLGSPNCFVPLDREISALKVKYIGEAFGTQRDKHWFSDETFWALLRLRGMECRAPGGYAEAFYSRKLVLSL